MTHEELVKAVARAVERSRSVASSNTQIARAALAAVRDRAELDAEALRLAAGWLPTELGDPRRAAALLRALAPGEGE